MSNSVWLHRRQPTRLCRPWDSPGKNTGVGCHFLLQFKKVKSESEVAQSVWLLGTPWTAAYQAPPSMGFSRQEYWSGVPLPSHIYMYTHTRTHKCVCTYKYIYTYIFYSTNKQNKWAIYHLLIYAFSFEEKNLKTCMYISMTISLVVNIFKTNLSQQSMSELIIGRVFWEIGK